MNTSKAKPFRWVVDGDGVMVNGFHTKREAMDHYDFYTAGMTPDEHYYNLPRRIRDEEVDACGDIVIKGGFYV
jgi:hypothetical protein